jgi:hypothetical protein
MTYWTMRGVFKILGVSKCKTLTVGMRGPQPVENSLVVSGRPVRHYCIVAELETVSPTASASPSSKYGCSPSA